MSENNKRNIDESVGFRSEPRLRIDEHADRLDSEQPMDGRDSQRASADLPHGLPTDNLHPDGFRSRDVATGFKDLRRGDQPHLEHQNMARNDNRVGSAGKGLSTNTSQKERRMADQNERNLQNESSSDAGYDRPTGEKSRYDAEKEIPDPEQVERDRQQAERFFKDRGKDVA